MSGFPTLIPFFVILYSLSVFSKSLVLFLITTQVLLSSPSVSIYLSSIMLSAMLVACFSVISRSPVSFFVAFVSVIVVFFVFR